MKGETPYVETELLLASMREDKEACEHWLAELSDMALAQTERDFSKVTWMIRDEQTRRHGKRKADERAGISNG